MYMPLAEMKKGISKFSYDSENDVEVKLSCLKNVVFHFFIESIITIIFSYIINCITFRPYKILN